MELDNFVFPPIYDFFSLGHEICLMQFNSEVGGFCWHLTATKVKSRPDPGPFCAESAHSPHMCVSFILLQFKNMHV